MNVLRDIVYTLKRNGGWMSYRQLAKALNLELPMPYLTRQQLASIDRLIVMAQDERGVWWFCARDSFIEDKP